MQKLWFAALAVVEGCVGSPFQEPERPDGPAFRRDGDTDGQDFIIWQESLESGPIAIYDIQNGFVYHGHSQQGNLLLNIHDGAIFDAANTTELCRYVMNTLVETSTDRVLFHTDGKAVYEGLSEIQAFSFKSNEIYRGDKRSGEPIGFAFVTMSQVDSERKLLIAALFSNRCGAPALP